MTIIKNMLLHFNFKLILLAALFILFMAPYAYGTQQQQIIIEPEQGIRPVVNIINSAQHSIQISIYQFMGYQHGLTPILHALHSAQQRGISITLLIHHFNIGDWPTGSHQLFLSEMQWCNTHHINCIPASSTFNLTHNKYMLIDHRNAYIMTCNLTALDFNHSRNVIIKVSNPSNITFLTRLFNTDINNAQHHSNLTPRPIPSTLVISPVNSTQKINRFIQQSRYSLNIYAMYFNKDIPRSILQSITNAAKHGVNIRILSNAKFNSRILRKLAKHNPNIKIKLINEKQQHFFIHAKVIIRDHSAALLGSTNMSYVSLTKNREVSLISKNPNIIKTLTITFNQDWTKSLIHSLPMNIQSKR